MPDVRAEVQQAVNSFAPVPSINRAWHPGPIDSNYDLNKTLSATLHTIEGATQSSPIQIALYRNGEYLAQGTPVAGAFIWIERDASTDDTVALGIRIPGDQGFKSTKSTHAVFYHYRDGRVYWSGDWPSEFPAPGFPQLPS